MLIMFELHAMIPSGVTITSYGRSCILLSYCAEAVRHAMYVMTCLLQEFTNGSRVYVGGFESIDRVCAGNPLGVTVVADMRGDRCHKRGRAKEP